MSKYTDSFNITSDRNQAVPQLSGQDVMMLWIPGIPKWSGLSPTINHGCRHLPNSGSTSRAIKQKNQHFTLHTYEVMWLQKDTDSQNTGMFQKLRERQNVNHHVSLTQLNPN